jgi:hypothetical protein
MLAYSNLLEQNRSWARQAHSEADGKDEWKEHDEKNRGRNSVRHSLDRDRQTV